MGNAEMVMQCISLSVPLATTLFGLFFGLRHFFKKKNPLFVQSLTMAMGSHALGSIYQLCLMISTGRVLDGFTPAYLGRMGFFLFILAASYGQLDRIVDDGSREMRPARWTALVAPLSAALLYVPNALNTDTPVETKIVYAVIWVPATISMYFNLKHAIIPDLDFNFVKAIKPYNVFVLCLGITELACLTAWNYRNGAAMIISSVIFGVLCIFTIIVAKKGVEKWII